MGNSDAVMQRQSIEFTKKRSYQKALELLEQNDNYKTHAVSMSCYALCKAALEFDVKSMEKLCRKALRLERNNPIIYLCMGRIYLLSGDRGLAYKVFKYGLKYSRKNRELMNELSVFGLRRALLFPSHTREHFLNRTTGIFSIWLGKDIAGFLPFGKAKEKAGLKRAALR
jgi:tetratricopeptide (TPR) repeat protein